MSRRISFRKTLPQFVDGSKTVTRRQGWKKLKTGDRLTAVDKVMGFRKGETGNILGEIEVISVRVEPLYTVTDADVEREGFPGRDAAWFVAFFRQGMGGPVGQWVRRIEFKHLSTLEERQALWAARVRSLGLGKVQHKVMI